MTKFESWYNKINEELENEPTVSVASDQEVADQPAQSAADNRDQIMHDVDHIMTSLETLAGELSEDVAINENELAYLGVAGAAVAAGLGIAAKKLFDITVAAPMARKKQAKVNTMSVKIAGVESSLASADKDQKDKIEAKLKVAKEQRDELQQTVDDRYSSAPKSVQRALASEKAKGKLASFEIIMGTASDSKKEEIKDQMSKLTQKIREEDQEFKKEAEEAKKAEISKQEQEKIEAGKKVKETSTETPAEETQAEKAPIKNSKKDKLERVYALIKKAEDTDNDALLQKAKALKDKIEAKESWQIDNTELGRLFEMEISILESSLIVEGLSVKDRFSKLL